MLRYEIIPKHFWRDDVGHTVSLYGAHPGPGYVLVTAGVSLRDNKSNTIHGQHNDTEQTIAERMDKFRPQWRTETV